MANVGLLISAECLFEICGYLYKVIAVSTVCAATGRKLILTQTMLIDYCRGEEAWNSWNFFCAVALANV